MSDEVHVTVKGLNEYILELNKFGVELAQKVELKALRKVANEIRKEAQRLAPAKSGKLRESIKVKKLSRSKYIRYAIYSRAPHAHLIEYGHKLTTRKEGRGQGRFIKFVAAHPFLRPAL